ncbi:hypothetical protein SSTU70S_02673 [Stutzerimonas stutzeri]
MTDSPSDRRRFQRIEFDATTELRRASGAGRWSCMICRFGACWCADRSSGTPTPRNLFGAGAAVAAECAWR